MEASSSPPKPLQRVGLVCAELPMRSLPTLQALLGLRRGSVEDGHARRQGEPLLEEAFANKHQIQLVAASSSWSANLRETILHRLTLFSTRVRWHLGCAGLVSRGQSDARVGRKGSNKMLLRRNTRIGNPKSPSGSRLRRRLSRQNTV